MYSKYNPNNYDNSNKGNTTVKGGIGFTGLLTLVFIVLKLCGVIEWSWLWVLSPLWISFGLGVLIIIIAAVIIHKINNV